MQGDRTVRSPEEGAVKERSTIAYVRNTVFCKQIRLSQKIVWGLLAIARYYGKSDGFAANFVRFQVSPKMSVSDVLAQVCQKLPKLPMIASSWLEPASPLLPVMMQYVDGAQNSTLF